MPSSPSPQSPDSTPASFAAAVWSSKIAFLIACIGAAVGLGNIWKFPYMAGTQGGGAFVLIYLISIFAIGIPIATAELLIGRGGRRNVVSSVRQLAKHTRYPILYAPIGVISIFTTFLLMTFYAVIAGWVMAYIWRALTGALNGLNAEGASQLFGGLLANPQEMIFWQVAFLALTGFVTARNIRSGLEKANVILMPLLFIMLLLIIGYGFVAGDIVQAVTFLFTPDFSKITANTILSAIGHGFFSVGVGTAILITYGAYVQGNMRIGEAAMIIGLADTVIALLAGIGIFAIVFAQNLAPGSGPGLIFTTLPLAFAQMPAGTILATIFFLLVLFAALTSALSITEVPVRWIHENFNIPRSRASFIVLFACFIVGLITVFSFNVWQDVRLASSGILSDKSLFDIKDYIASNILLPLGGLLIVSFAAWVMPVEQTSDYFGKANGFYKIWLWLARIVAPIGIIWVFLANL